MRKTSHVERMEHTFKGEKGLRSWYQSYTIFSFKNKSQLHCTIWIRRNQSISWCVWGLSYCLLLILKLEILICLLFLPLSHGKLQLSPRDITGTGEHCVEIAVPPVGLWRLIYASICVNVCVSVCSELHSHPRVQWHRHHHSLDPQWHQPSGEEADGPGVRTEGK